MQIKFGYPRRGLSGRFNTFRLGRRLYECLAPGVVVELVDARSGTILKRATVEDVFVGQLAVMASRHAQYAHNWKEFSGDRAQALIASLKKRYPPNRVQQDSVVTVIYLKADE